jgi:mediator of RNA polymerase II transcription subunit 12
LNVTSGRWRSDEQFLITALTSNEDEEILDVVIDSIRRDADVWTANDKWPLLANALMDRLQSQDARGRHHAALAELLLELAKRGRIGEDDEDEVKASVRKNLKVSRELGFLN